MDVNVFTVEMAAPDDVSGLEKLFDSGELDPRDVVAVLAKTEGNGCVNDFTRGYSTLVFTHLLAQRLSTTAAAVHESVAFVMSGGTEGVMTPHATVFARNRDRRGPGTGAGLAIGVGFTREFRPEELGTRAQAMEVSRVVRETMADAGIERSEDVHFVQIKCPLLTSDRIADAERRGERVVIEDTYKSMGYSRGASALGAAVAIGEIEDKQVTDEAILHDWSLYSNVASTSAGVELTKCEVILLGNSESSTSAFRIGHSVMKDAIDISAVLESLHSAGLEFTGLPDEKQCARIVNVLAKAEADPGGRVRGRRNTMLTDSDINHTRHARGVVNGVVGAVVGTPMVYVSGGAEHQGPPGGGPIAAIVRK